MSGVLPTSERNQLIERLRETARRAYRWECQEPDESRHRQAVEDMSKAWLAFPENQDDANCPHYSDVQRIIYRLDQEEAERKRHEELMKRM